MLNTNINNVVTLEGTVVRGAEYSHEIYGESFYTVLLQVKRDSGTDDVLPVLISDRLCSEELRHGTILFVRGEYRSYNKHTENSNKLILSVFAREIEINKTEKCNNLNEAVFTGYICKSPVYRKTPLGREIADIMFVVNRSYGKSDYIPLICWGRNARFISELKVGKKLQIWGRIQSREYVKKLYKTESEVRTAYEVSVSRLELTEE
nr:MAG TPA: Single strand binding protein [Caudoviricetes sp.]